MSWLATMASGASQGLMPLQSPCSLEEGAWTDNSDGPDRTANNRVKTSKPDARRSRMELGLASGSWAGVQSQRRIGYP